MKGRVEGPKHAFANGEKASWWVIVPPSFPGIVQIYACYLSILFNITPFIHGASVLATNYMATLLMRYMITAFSCLKDCHMEKT